MTDLKRVTDKYAGVKLCDLNSQELEEFLGAIAKRGAANALASVGLSDPEAVTDVKDLRDIMRGFRVMKKAAWKQVCNATGRVIGWVLIMGVLALMMNGDKGRTIVARIAAGG